MKDYCVPTLSCIDLRAEENIAMTAGCLVGCCYNDLNHNGHQDPGEPLIYSSQSGS